MDERVSEHRKQIQFFILRAVRLLALVPSPAAPFRQFGNTKVELQLQFFFPRTLVVFVCFIFAVDLVLRDFYVPTYLKC